MRRARAAALLLAAGLLLAAAAGAAEVTAEASIDPEIGLQDAATLSITVSGQGFGGLDEVPTFALENLRVVRGPFQSQNFSWINGKASSSVTLTWQLAPEKVGPAKVYAIKVKAKDQEIALPEQKVDVQQASPNGRATGNPPRNPIDAVFEDPFGRRARPQREAKLFLRAEVAPDKPLVGQQALYTLYLYTQTDVSAANAQVVPSFRGFWTRDVPQPQRQLRPDMVDFDGERYARVALLQKALFPLAAGPITIEPARFELVARTPSIGPFGQLMPELTQIDRGSNPVTLDVAALPPGPAGFPGTVGKLKLDARIEPALVRAGEAATLTVTLSGQGNLQGVPDPTLPALPGVRVFPPQKSGSEDFQGTTVVGRRVWSYVLVPEREGAWTVPAIAVPYFDLDSRTYRTAESVELALNAAPPAAPAARTQEAPASPAPTATAPAPPLWMVGLAGAAGGAALVGLGLWIVAATRRRGRAGAARRRLLQALAGAQRESRPRPAAEAAELAWREFFAERWSIPTSTPPERWADELVARGAEPGRVDDVRRLADDIHYLRHAPQLSATDTLQAELHDLSRRLAGALA